MEKTFNGLNKKTLISVIIICVLVAGASFYGGMLYGKKSSSTNMPNDFRNANSQGQGNAGQRRMASGGFTNGEILSKDDKSITLKLRDGGSKIIFFSNSTQIMKTSTGTIEDIGIGKNVVITGNANSDGSINAQTIQLRDGGFGSNAPKQN